MINENPSHDAQSGQIRHDGGSSTGCHMPDGTLAFSIFQQGAGRIDALTATFATPDW